MRNNEYLESFKLQAVKRIYAGESQKSLCSELRLSKSTLWGWKCKYHELIEKEITTKEKPVEESGFIEIIKPMKETKSDPVFKYQKDNVIEIDYKGFKIFFDIRNLSQILEILS